MCTNAILSDCIRELNALPFNTNLIPLKVIHLMISNYYIIIYILISLIELAN